VKIAKPTLLAGTGIAAIVGLLVWRSRNETAPFFSFGQGGGSRSAPAIPKGSSLPAGPLPAGTTGLTSYLPEAFFVGISAMGDHFRSRGATITDEDLLAILMAESGIRADVPNRVNKVCLGLNQICPKLAARRPDGTPLDLERVSGLRAVGFQGSLTDYSALSETAQLPFVQKYFDNVNNYRAMRNVGSLYLANFSPAFLGKPEEFVMYRPEGITHDFLKSPSNPTGFFGSNFYNDNATVDKPRKGFIQVSDMAKFPIRSVSGDNAAKWNELRMRLQRVAGVA